MLAAQAMDTQDGLIRQAEWRSSRDGVLGSGLRLHDIALSPGEHTLTVKAKDSAGAEAIAEVKVRVGAVSQVDLALPADALWLHRAGQNPASALPVTVTAGVTHTVFLRVDGAGAPLSATVALTMTPPGGSPQLLKRAILPLEIFGHGTLSATFLPVVTGDYRFVASIESASLPDPEVTNNRRVWRFRNDLPVTQSERVFLPVFRR